MASILMLRGQSCPPGTVGTPVKGGGTRKKKGTKKVRRIPQKLVKDIRLGWDLGVGMRQD